MPAPAFVYIVDDDAAVRKSVRRLVNACGYESADFQSAGDFLNFKERRRPACLILDVQLPGMDGLALQQKLEESGQSIPIIFITGHGDIPMSVRAIKKGAFDFLPKPFTFDVLKRSIEQALARDVQITTMEQNQKNIRSSVEKLTPRELEVLRWVIAGKLNKQIASELGAAEKTIKVHRGRVMEKMGIHSVAELVRLAEIAGISPAD